MNPSPLPPPSPAMAASEYAEAVARLARAAECGRRWTTLTLTLEDEREARPRRKERS